MLCEAVPPPFFRATLKSLFSVIVNAIAKKVEAQVSISASKAQVWKTISNIAELDKVLSGVEKIEILFQPSNGWVNLKWRETRLYVGKPAAIDKWIVEATENEHYRTRAEMDGFIFETTLSVHAENEGGTILTSIHEYKAGGFLAKLKSLPMIFFKGALKKAIQQDLDDIKTAIEWENKPR